MKITDSLNKPLMMRLLIFGGGVGVGGDGTSICQVHMMHDGIYTNIRLSCKYYTITDLRHLVFLSD